MATNHASGNRRDPRRSATLRLGSASVTTAIVGPLVAHLGLASPLAGFVLLAFGLLLGLLALALGIMEAVRSAPGTRAPAVVGAGLGAIVVLAALLGGREAFRHPRINDITTDTQRPPEFVAAPGLPGNAGRDMRYPGEAFARQQREAYPALAPLATSVPPAEAFALVSATARATQGWTITRDDRAARALEGVDTSWLFRFQDDFVIEVRDTGAGSRIEMRSKSRVGKGDSGANARRIEQFFARLRAQPGWR